MLVTRQADYQRLLREAVAAGKQRDYLRAVDLLTQITSETDSLPIAFLYLGRGYHALKRFDLAIQPLKYFIELNPNSTAGYLFLGRAYLALGIPAAAVQNLKKVLDLHPDSVAALSLIGIAYLRARRPEIAAGYLERAVSLDPENRKLYTGYLNALLVQALRLFRRGDLDLARQMLEFVEQRGNTGILVQLHLAIVCREQGDLAGALSHYDAAVRISPEDPVIRLQRAELLHRAGRKKQAEEELRSLDILPQPDQFSWDPAATDRVLAIQSFRKGDHHQAIFYAEKVLHRAPKDVEMHLLVGESYRVLQDFEKASNHFMRARDVDRNLLEPHYGLAMVHWQKEQWNETLGELKIVDRIDPDNPISSYYSALCACKLEESSEKTIPALQSEIRRAGPDAFLFSALGEEYIRSGRTELAEKWFKKAIQLVESHQAAYLGLIRVYRGLGQGREAQEAYSNYLARFSNDPEIRREFIHFLVDAHDYVDAAVEIEHYIPYQRRDKKLKRLLALCKRKSGKYRDAAVIYRQLLRDEPMNEELLRSLIYCMEKLGNRENALQLLEKAVEHFKQPSVTLLLILGVLHYKSENIEKALSAFRRAEELSKGDWRIHRNIAMVYQKQGLQSLADKHLAKSERLKKGAVAAAPD